MKNFWKKHKIFVAVGVFLLVVLPLLCWAASYMIKRIQIKAELIQERIVDNDLEKSKIDKIPKMDEVNAEFEKNKNATGVILNSNNKVDFIKYIESLAADTNNEIEIKVLNDNPNVSVANNTTKAKVKKNTADDGEKNIEEQLPYKQYVSMEVDLTGDYGDFLNFVHKLENNKYYVNILSFNLQKELVNKDNSLKKQNSASNGIFLSPPGQAVDAGSGNDGVLMLKSSLNIIVYIE